MRRGRGIRGGRPQRKVIEITSRSIPIRAEPSSTSIVLCAQSQGRISLVLEEKDNYGTKWFRIGAGWMCSKDANGFQCYQFTNEVIAQKYWAKEFPNIGVNIPQKIACIAIANPNSVFEVPPVDSNSLE